MEHPKDIQSLDDIKLLVNHFYGLVREDDLIGPVFNGVIQDRWPAHLEKMYRFWQTVLLETHTYEGRPFPPHAQLPVDKQHFERWVSLFHRTLDTHFSGEVADEARWRAVRMAEMFLTKILYYRDKGGVPLM